MRPERWCGSVAKDLMEAMKLLQEHRPTDVHSFLAAVLNDQPIPEHETGPEKAHEGNIYAYIQSFGIFTLLRPALLCCDRDRPKNPKKYIATFLAESMQALE